MIYNTATRCLPEWTVRTPEWTAHAKCRGLGMADNPSERDLHFPTDRAGRAIASAKRFCHGCPVANQCLRAGMNEQHGVFGGLTPDERRRLRARGATLRLCPSCRLRFVARPADPTICTGCTRRGAGERGPEDFKTEILAMAAAGKSGEQIRARFGLSRDQLRTAAAAWQVSLMRPAARARTTEYQQAAAA